MIYVSVGSNIDPATHVPAAVARLTHACNVVDVSPFYLVPAIDRPDQAPYWNGVIALEHEPSRLPALLRLIEHVEGRIRTDDKWAARTLDLDIVIDADGNADREVHGRPFLARCLADLGALPRGIPDPGHRWPVVWTRQAQH